LLDQTPQDLAHDIGPLLVNWWAEKNEAIARLAADGKSDTGAQARNAKHMQSIAMFVRQMFVDAGLSDPNPRIARWADRCLCK
jgi:hypothetical protein